METMISRVDLQSFANGSNPRIQKPTSLADLYTTGIAPMCAAATAYDDGWSISVTPLIINDTAVLLFEEHALDGSYHQQSVLMFEQDDAGWTTVINLCATAGKESISFCNP
ncbi:hypothetical protein [Marivita sp. S0852]|uniref:hypothetical protein n=1 Tax=Marivita sp. S0852 TaxID=3373893 RepID=UPI003982B0AB